ncbi:hypothetical protein D5086_008472 [Populus alba]|uniref:Uncharacterized protein n=1 Tax=Populus alba TaxID=43335 RepID=A0ACC4CH43_POPAL
MSSGRPQPAKLAIPWRTRLVITMISAATDLSRRSNGTVNRRLLNLLDFKSSPSPNKPINSIISSDITVDPTRNLWFRLYTPGNSGVDGRATASLPVVVFFHGVNYRLTPEHRFPCQYDDGLDVLRFLNNDDRASGLLPPNADLSKCFLPYFGGQERTESELRLVGYPFVTVERTDWCWRVFLPDGSDRDHYAVNVSGPNAENISDLDFPDTMVIVGGFDPLKDWQKSWWVTLPHFLQTWLRNYIAGTLLYFISGFLWCFYIYYLKRNVYVPKDTIPSNRAMLLQIYVAMKAMPCYTLLPTVSEYMIEKWLDKVELHDIKPLYKYLHATHHIYNKQNTLSPFAGLAFHPIDGILQAVPHVIALFLVPTHFRSHVALLFIEAIWTANIHDCIHANLWPVMGAGYHTIHHTTYKHNYGHYTIWMDWMLGTLRDPEDDSCQRAQKVR